MNASSSCDDTRESHDGPSMVQFRSLSGKVDKMEKEICESSELEFRDSLSRVFSLNVTNNIKKIVLDKPLIEVAKSIYTDMLTHLNHPVAKITQDLVKASWKFRSVGSFILPAACFVVVGNTVGPRGKYIIGEVGTESDRFGKLIQLEKAVLLTTLKHFFDPRNFDDHRQVAQPTNQVIPIPADAALYNEAILKAINHARLSLTCMSHHEEMLKDTIEKCGVFRTIEP